MIAKCDGYPTFQAHTGVGLTSMALSSAGVNLPLIDCALTCSPCGNKENAPTPSGLEQGFVAAVQHLRNSMGGMVQPIERYSLDSAYSGCADSPDSARVTPPCIGNKKGMAG